MAKAKRTSKPLESQESQENYIIPIMGPAGAGKSFFINSLLRKDVLVVGHDLTSCTSAFAPVEIPMNMVQKHLPLWHPESAKAAKLILVDTPGFDNARADDSQVLQKVADWLATSYGVGAKLAGVIYLQDITQSRVTGATKRNFGVLDKLCGVDACKSVVLATTKWQRLHPEDSYLGLLREQQLRDNFWSDMIARGSTMRRVDNKTNASPWDVVWTVLSKGQSSTLLIEEGLVKLSKSLPQTEEAQVLRARIEELMESLTRAGFRPAEDVAALGSPDHPPIILAAESSLASNFNPVAYKLAQESIYAPTTPSSTTTEYGSVLIFWNASSQPCIRPIGSLRNGRARTFTL